MKNQQFKIRVVLLSSLVAIMSILIVLYMAFCLDGDYNKAQIKETYTETPTKAPENQNQMPQLSLPATPDNNNTQEESNETSSFPAIDVATYNPVENLTTENWAVTLVNKNFGLGKNFYPSNVVAIGTDIYVDSRVAEQFNLMYQAALSEENKINLTPFSGYQNYSTQKKIYDEKVQYFITQNPDNEEKAVADTELRIPPAGYNENGAGLAIDFAPASADFASTQEFQWLIMNAHKYGFVLRYPEGKTEITGMIYQPWHWRYVGVEAATEMKEKNLCLEEYLGVK